MSNEQIYDDERAERLLLLLRALRRGAPARASFTE